MPTLVSGLAGRLLVVGRGLPPDLQAGGQAYGRDCQQTYRRAGRLTGGTATRPTGGRVGLREGLPPDLQAGG